MKYSNLRNTKVDIKNIHRSDKTEREKIVEDIQSQLLDPDTFYHVNTRWLRLFKEGTPRFQKASIEKVIDIYQSFITDAIKNKITPIDLEGLGKFVIMDGRRDFLDLSKSDEFDGNYDEVRKEVIKRQKERIHVKHEINKAKKENRDYHPTIEVKWKNS